MRVQSNFLTGLAGLYDSKVQTSLTCIGLSTPVEPIVTAAPIFTVKPVTPSQKPITLPPVVTVNPTVNPTQKPVVTAGPTVDPGTDCEGLLLLVIIISVDDSMTLKEADFLKFVQSSINYYPRFFLLSKRSSLKSHLKSDDTQPPIIGSLNIRASNAIPPCFHSS